MEDETLSQFCEPCVACDTYIFFGSLSNGDLIHCPGCDKPYFFVRIPPDTGFLSDTVEEE